MRLILFILTLCALAIGLALFTGDNRAWLSLFWGDQRIQLSLNLFLLILSALFVLLYFALRAMESLRNLPQRARTWRALHHERGVYHELIQGWVQLHAGRFSRARKAAERALHHAPLAGGELLAHQSQLSTLDHLLIAESAHRLRDEVLLDIHIQHAHHHAQNDIDLREGVSLRVAQWAIEAGKAKEAERELARLPRGAQRRVQALRLKLKTARLNQQGKIALETARLLIKHQAFAPNAAQTLLLRLVCDYLDEGRDGEQIQTIWQDLSGHEQSIPAVIHHAAECLRRWGESDAKNSLRVRTLLLQLLDQYSRLPATLQLRLVHSLLQLPAPIEETPHKSSAQKNYLSRIEQLQQIEGHNIPAQYLAAVTYKHYQLWGKAQQLLRTLSKNPKTRSEHPDLLRKTYLHLAELAERDGDSTAALHAWREAAKSPYTSSAGEDD